MRPTSFFLLFNCQTPVFTIYLLHIQIFFNDLSRFLHFQTVYFDHKVNQLLFIDKTFS